MSPGPGVARYRLRHRIFSKTNQPNDGFLGSGTPILPNATSVGSPSQSRNAPRNAPRKPRGRSGVMEAQLGQPAFPGRSFRPDGRWQYFDRAAGERRPLPSRDSSGLWSGCMRWLTATVRVSRFRRLSITEVTHSGSYEEGRSFSATGRREPLRPCRGLPGRFSELQPSHERGSAS